MLKSGLVALVLVTGAVGGALAQTPTTSGGLDGYELSQFETKEMSVAVATDKKSGRKFNVVKLPSGKMMILLSSTKLQALSPFTDDSEMMYSGHTGTTR